ncbi:hypothetical protein EYZ11_005963 [Aspergillus tanneri]|uniref:Uncharacterized protein n=1 Tax=Aspergillus tanneri TaxID=1220188 RepID=A0A4V3UPI3_9EURO|nr:hypothetical protein EYZ11_005963 [Aspergillus tanneri]
MDMDPVAVAVTLDPLSSPVVGTDTPNGSVSNTTFYGHLHSHSHGSVHENGWGGMSHGGVFHTHTAKHSHSESVPSFVHDNAIASSSSESNST